MEIPEQTLRILQKVAGELCLKGTGLDRDDLINDCVIRWITAGQPAKVSAAMIRKQMLSVVYAAKRHRELQPRQADRRNIEQAENLARQIIDHPKLSKKYRHFLTLRYIDGKPIKQIAGQRLGTKEYERVHNIIEKAKIRLKKLLQENNKDLCELLCLLNDSVAQEHATPTSPFYK